MPERYGYGGKEKVRGCEGQETGGKDEGVSGRMGGASP
jgi:hypothetical protein